jgi:transcriptional regulator with XRE-family HTH domain
MTGEEFRRIREDLGLSTEKFGRGLGYHGTYGIAARHIRRFESGARPIPQTIGRLVEMFRRHGVPDSWAH